MLKLIGGLLLAAVTPLLFIFTLVGLWILALAGFHKVDWDQATGAND